MAQLHLYLYASFGYRNCIKILITIVSFIHIAHSRSFRDMQTTQYFPHAGMTQVNDIVSFSVVAITQLVQTSTATVNDEVTVP